MGGNAEMRTNGLTPKTAYIINDQFGAKSKKEIKNAVNDELQRLLQNGEITKDEAKAARKFVDNKIAAALVRRNNVERTAYETVYGFDDLENPKADKLMKDSGLTINDLYEASQFAGAEIIHQANRKEKAFGEQGGPEGGEGSVTNKTEAKMHDVGTLAAEAMESGDVPSPKPIEDPWKKLMEE